MYDTIIVGGGQAGLATAYQLQNAGLDYLLLNAAPEPTGSWPRYYDSLKLFSPAHYASLPGLSFPGDPEHYPVRDEVISYLKSYVLHFNLNIKNEIEIVFVANKDGLFYLQDSAGDSYEARTVVVATGSFNIPFMPDLPGQDIFEGERIHALEYQNPDRYTGKRVVVVGAANTAVQIAVELAKTSRVTLAVRNKINFVPQRVLGKDLHFWLGISGLDNLSLLKDQSTPVMDTGVYRKAVREKAPDVRPMFKEFTNTGVVWDDDEPEDVDVVLFATGYQPNLGYLNTLDAQEGTQGFKNGVHRNIPGLYCMGFSGQRSFSSATLRGVGRDGAYIVHHIQSYLCKS